tara:strand:+ start:115 stop:822 length:708 start_codon:yes stop_codon:yes gene_type:complete
MARSEQLRWKKVINQLRYMYEELDIINDMINEAAPAFQEYYEEYCMNRDIDISELNRKHAERIKQLYPPPPEIDKSVEFIEYTGSVGLVAYAGDMMNTDNYIVDEDDRDMHDIFTKLFKKLATVVHPDKWVGEEHSDSKRKEMQELFSTVVSALKEKRYFVLIDCAEKVDVPVPDNFKQQVRWMNKELDQIRSKIGSQMRTYNYLFAEAETASDKDNVIRDFMHQVFGYDPENNS